jgi:predicted regulator of Ras-like GTPase activity (Roadblock/LC7/MglB family)
MFQYVLANLLANNDHCMGVLFLDAGGETVDLACSAMSHYEMRVLGAYLGIYLRQLDRIVANNNLGEPRLVHIEKRSVHIYAVPLPDGYYLAMVQRQPAMVARTRASLEEAVRQLTRELFPESLPAAPDRGNRGN